MLKLTSVMDGLRGGWRKKLVSPLEGDILEIGVGTGANLRHYRSAAAVSAIEPDAQRARAAEEAALQSARALVIPIQVQVGVAEQLPYLDESFDVVVSSLVFCSVEEPLRALSEIRRVLKPHGDLWMVEHVRPQNPLAASLAAAMTPFWQRVACNCHLDRPTLALLDQEGWQVTLLNRRGLFVKLVARAR